MNQSIPVLGIPHYNRPDLLARCIASIDYPVEKLVIVQNGPAEDMVSLDNGMIHGFDKNYKLAPVRGAKRPVIRLGKYQQHLIGEIVIIRHPNAGCAGAWNEIIKLFPSPWWMIVNNDIQFTPGDLEKMAHAAQLNTHATNRRADVGPIGMFYGNHGASFFIITAYGVMTVGLFDENIFPAYLEDCDWARRADLLKVRRENVQGINAIHGDQFADGHHGSATIYSNDELRQKNGRTHGNNFRYYVAKWGGVNGKEEFATPYNDPAWPIAFWHFNPAFRQQQQW